MIPGEILTAPGDIELNAAAAADRLVLAVANTGDRPVQVGSHYHFAETNPALDFDRARAHGRRLDIPAGTALRFEPGQRRDIVLIPYGGRRIANGFRGAVMGALEQIRVRWNHLPGEDARQNNKLDCAGERKRAGRGLD